MLVDDSQVFLGLLKEIIKTEVTFDTKTISFSNSTLAKEQFLQLAPDIVITDIEMPYIDGLQLIEYMKSVRPTPILAMSGSTMKDNSTDTILYCAKSIGADYAMLKDDIVEKFS